MTNQVHYEVLVKQNHRWEIHSRHSHTQKEQAIVEAKALDGLPSIQAVKVIREIYDPDDGSYKENNVYAPGQKKYQPQRKSKKNRSEAEDVEAEAFARKRKKTKPSRSLVSLLLTITIISGFSTVVGALITWFAGMYLAEMDVNSSAQINVMFIVFLSVFTLSAAPLAMTFLGKDSNA